ncbi:unnamed protein product [Diamesa tonsa]
MKRDYASSYRSSTVSAAAVAAAAATVTMSPTTITTGTSTTLTAGESSIDPESLFIKCVEGEQHKETYVNMLYTNSIPSCSSSDYPYNRNALPIDASHVPPGIIESPEEDDDDEMTNKTRKQKRGIFKLKPLNLMKSGSYKLKQLSPQPLPQNQTPETPCGGEEKLSAASNHPQHAHDHHKTTKSSRLKKLFFFSSANTARKRNVESLLTEFRGISCSSSKTIENRTNSDAAEDCDDAEMGMKTAETQTELIECSSPSPISFQLQDEQVLPSTCQQQHHQQQQTDNNNEHCRLDINTLKNHRDIKNIDDEDAASGRRIIFSQDNTETNL